MPDIQPGQMITVEGEKEVVILVADTAVLCASGHMYSLQSFKVIPGGMAAEGSYAITDSAKQGLQAALKADDGKLRYIAVPGITDK